MIDPQREPLEGVVEVDQTELPFRADNSFFDPLKSGKILIRHSPDARRDRAMVGLLAFPGNKI